MNPVCWFEIYVSNMERARKFYTTVLGLEIIDAPVPEGHTDYQMAFFPGTPDAPNASGALVKMEGMKQNGVATVSTIAYFGCEDCSVEESRVEAAGGKVFRQKFSIGEYGYCSICMDTEGNTFGLYSMK